MANYHNVGPSISGGRAMPWSPKEEELLAHAFIDLDLDGGALHGWCRKHNILRSPGAIDARLAKLNFFDTREIRLQMGREAKSKAFHPRLKPSEKLRAELARKELANQIKLALIEAPTAPLYMPKPEECMV